MFKTNYNLRFKIISTLIIMILGVVFHFVYEWSGNNIFVGLFSAVNESIWEHLKLIYFPMLLITLIGYFFLRKSKPNYLCSKVVGILTAMIFTVVFFYTYSGIIGNHFSVIDISIFFMAVTLGQYVSYKVMKLNFSCNEKIAKITLIIIFLLLLIFTFFPPHIALFQDPVNGSFGIPE